MTLFNRRPGNSVMLAVGGAAESLVAAPRKYDLVRALPDTFATWLAKNILFVDDWENLVIACKKFTVFVDFSQETGVPTDGSESPKLCTSHSRIP